MRHGFDIEFAARRVTVRDFAALEAIRALSEMAKSELPNGLDHLFMVRVLDSSRREIFTARLDFHSSWTD